MQIKGISFLKPHLNKIFQFGQFNGDSSCQKCQKWQIYIMDVWFFARGKSHGGFILDTPPLFWKFFSTVCRRLVRGIKEGWSVIDIVRLNSWMIIFFIPGNWTYFCGLSSLRNFLSGNSTKIKFYFAVWVGMMKKIVVTLFSPEKVSWFW